MSFSIVQVFNRYLMPGGEEKSVQRIHDHLALHHRISHCRFESSEWTGPAAPSHLRQLGRLFYNPQSRAAFESHCTASGAQLALFHNLYPVGSPSLYKAALDARMPVIQYLHNYRPFSVGGTLHAQGRLMPEALGGDYSAEIIAGSWQSSVLKSALFAILLKLLHRSGWLGSVALWVAISDFMRQQLIRRAGIPPHRIVSLRHSWDAMPELPPRGDDGSYLFLGRLVEEKGVKPLLAAWSMLHQQLGPRCPGLVIAGEGPLQDEVCQTAATLPCVRYAGQLAGSAKSEALGSCRAILVPSTWWEPLGLVVYEAYDHGKPVLAARAGGLAETVLHGTTGLLHAPGDAAAIARDVLTFDSLTRDTRLAMGDAGRRWLLDEASPQRWLASMDAHLAAVVASSGLAR